MNDQTKSIWRKAWPGVRGRILWVVLFLVAVFAVIFVFGLSSGFDQPTGMAVFALAGTGAFAVVGALLALFFRWLGLGRNVRGFVFGVVCVVTVVALFYAEENWRGKRAWDRFKRTWEAKGEHFSVAEVAPPAVPDDENFAMAPIVMTSYGQLLDGKGNRVVPPNTNLVNLLDLPIEIYGDAPKAPGLGDWRKGLPVDLGAWQTYYRGVAATTNLFPVPVQPQSPAQDVLLALSKYDTRLEELRQAGTRRYSRFPLPYDTDPPAAILLPHLAKMKTCSRLLRLRALAELRSGQAQTALSDILLILRLQETLESEPFLISQLVRIAIVDLALQPVWEGLNDHLWSDGQLATLEGALDKVDGLEAYQLGMRGELVCTSGTIDYLRRTRQISEILGITDPLGLLVMRWGPGGWFYQNKLRCAQMMFDQYLPVVDMERRSVSPAKTRESAAALDREAQHKNPYNWILVYASPALSQAIKKFAFAQASVDLARIACALERYRLAHGNYPDKLETLTPEFIASLPHDVIGGQPLRYHPTADGTFQLYSIGWNEADDGGKTVLNSKGDRLDPDQGDWVWPSH